MKELAKEFDGEFSRLGENPKTYTTFSALITNKVKRIDKKWERNYKKISYKQQFIDRTRFINEASSLSHLLTNVGNLAEGIQES